jgi:Outer membrane protein beta-barrel domain
MRKIFVMIVAVLAFAMVAAATDFPTSELYVGYNFTRFYPDSAFVPDLNANGGVGQFTYNFDKWIGATFDVGSVTKGTLNHANWDTTATSFTLGPRFMYHNHSRWTPYFEVLFGGAEVSASTEVGTFVAPPVVAPAINPPVALPPGYTFTTRITTSKTGFAMLVGGGLDIKFGKHFAFRPLGLDYYLARMPSAVTGNDTNHNNLRYTAGVNFLFGAK